MVEMKVAFDDIEALLENQNNTLIGEKLALTRQITAMKKEARLVGLKECLCVCSYLSLTLCLLCASNKLTRVAPLYLSTQQLEQRHKEELDALYQKNGEETNAL